jgi:alpha-mannosidase
VRRGYELNNPLIAFETGSHNGRLPSAHSFVRVSSSNLVVTALKKAEDSNDLILRFYECKGGSGDAGIAFGFGVSKVQETDLSERPLSPLIIPVNADSITVPFGKWEIKTLKLRLN